MHSSRFVAGDWGTTSLRLFLCDADGGAADSREGPGAAETKGRFAGTLASLMAPWIERFGPLPAVLCGMVGSNIGWTEAPYVPAPALPEAIVEACVRLPAASAHILPGLSCRNRFGAPDFMRGEETQIIGALALDAKLRSGTHLLCLPGTHTKWATVHNGAIRDFFSAPTGEVYAVLRDHSVLVRNPEPSSELEPAAFQAGLARLAHQPRAALLHLLFECRARQLSGELSPGGAEAFLSGLLIASDVRGALESLPGEGSEFVVTVVGSPILTRRYTSALTAIGCSVRAIDGSAASLQGLVQAHRHIQERMAA